MYIGDQQHKIFHAPHCKMVKMIAPRHQAFFFLEEEARQDYQYCPYCARVMRYYYEDQKHIDEFVADYDMQLSFNSHDGSLEIHTKKSHWKFYVAPYKDVLQLYHKNTFATDFDEATCIPDYHLQHVYKESMIEYLKYIVSHDAFRSHNPYEIPTTMKEKHYTKGSKKYRKEAKRIRKVKGKITARRVNELLRDLHKSS